MNSNTDISFILFDFHKYFDGIIGLNKLRRFNFSIDLVNKQFKNNQLNIPILYRQAQHETYHITVNAHEVVNARVPVSQDNIGIIIPECVGNSQIFTKKILIFILTIF